MRSILTAGPNFRDHLSGPDETITALTDDGIEGPTDMLRDARNTTGSWHQFLDGFVHDAELVARIKAQSPR